jgi:phosphatidylglycerophosphatase C
LATLVAAVRLDRDRMKEIIVGGSLRGKLVADVERKGEQFAQYVLVNWLRPDTLRRLQWHQRSGHRIVFVSASLAAYLRPMAQRLGIDDVLCTDSLRSGDRYSDRLNGPNCRAAEKRRRFDQWLEEQRWVDVEVWAYGDSAGDRELLARADHAVWVNGETISEAPEVVAG